MTNLFDYVLLAMAAYVLVAGIRGKGRLYSVEFVKEGKEEIFKKTQRGLYIGLGAAMLLNSCASILTNYLYTYDEAYNMVPARELGQFAFLTPTLLKTLTFVFLGFTIAGVVALVIVIRKFTDKEAQKRAAQRGAAGGGAQAARQAGHILPVSAFDFDDEAEEAADAPADPEEKA